MKLPDVVGFKLTGKLREGVNFVEYYGEGYRNLDLADRATLANMGPEYGATTGFCPVDGKTIEYLRLTGRSEEHIDTVEKYCKEQGLWYTEDPEYTDTLELDLSTVVPCLAGHKRPQDLIPMTSMKESFADTLKALGVEEQRPAVAGQLGDGSLVIASITSCTNTANPSVMIAAGLVAKKAADLGLRPKDYVKTSLAPGSRVVTQYLQNSGLLVYLEKLGFQVCGYGCMTCIGNSGPLSDEVSNSIKANDLVVAAIASSNRNFEGRIHPLVKANYLASPPLVVAYAIAGRVDIDLDREPLAVTEDGREVFLRDIWPSDAEVSKLVDEYVTRPPSSPSTGTSSRDPPGGTPSSARTPRCSPGTRTPPTSATRRSSTTSSKSPRSGASTAPGASPSWATPSPPTTSPPPGRSPRSPPPARSPRTPTPEGT